MEYIENLSRNNDFFVGNNQREIEREREIERPLFQIRNRLFAGLIQQIVTYLPYNQDLGKSRGSHA